jgi:hypothetical protein
MHTFFGPCWDGRLTRHGRFLDGAYRCLEKPGAPLLLIPAAQTVWMKETTPVMGGASVSPSKSDDEYEYLVCDSNSLAHTGIRLDTRMMSDHFPSRYEHAFHHLKASAPSVTLGQA